MASVKMQDISLEERETRSPSANADGGSDGYSCGLGLGHGDSDGDGDAEGGLWDRMGRWWFSHVWEGQSLRDGKVAEGQSLDSSSFFERHRKLLSFLLPGTLVHIAWWTYMSVNNLFYLFTEQSSGGAEYYWMSVTMIFGSMVAGMTSEGGAAVAFPVMTLAMGITPLVARDFSFMIQSAGMTSAAVTLYLMRVNVEWRALLHGSLGGFAGIVVGLEVIAPRLPPAFKKMYFVSIWAAFAFSLYWLNRMHDRKTFLYITRWSDGELRAQLGPQLGAWLNWKAILLFAFGVLGGVFSAISGSGIDICVFALLTLFFRVSEKIATPTSVMLMAINTLIGFFWREVVQEGVADEAWKFFAVCVPVVVIGAPMGSLLGSHLHRLILAGLVYILDAAQLIAALAIIKPWTTNNTDKPLLLSLSSLAIILFGAVFFWLFSKAGGRYLASVLEKDDQDFRKLAGTELTHRDLEENIKMGNPSEIARPSSPFR